MNNTSTRKQNADYSQLVLELQFLREIEREPQVKPVSRLFTNSYLNYSWKVIKPCVTDTSNVARRPQGLTARPPPCTKLLPRATVLSTTSAASIKPLWAEMVRRTTRAFPPSLSDIHFTLLSSLWRRPLHRSLHSLCVYVCSVGGCTPLLLTNGYDNELGFICGCYAEVSLVFIVQPF